MGNQALSINEKGKVIVDAIPPDKIDFIYDIITSGFPSDVEMDEKEKELARATKTILFD